MPSLLKEVIAGSMHDIDTCLADPALPDLLARNNRWQNVIEIAIERREFRIMERIVRKLQELNRTEELKILLKINAPFAPSPPDPWYIKWIPRRFQRRVPSPIPLINAAREKDPQFYEFLMKQYPGHRSAVLDEVKKERLNIFASERRWGFPGAVLKSLCPSKAAADFVNIPEILAGFGLAVGVGLLAAITIPAAIVAGIGLYFLGTANYKKIKTEQNIEDNKLDTTILLSKLSNYQARIKSYTVQPTPEEQEQLKTELYNLLEEIKAIQVKTKRKKNFLWKIASFFGVKGLILRFTGNFKTINQIKITPVGSKKTNQDFLSPKDKKYANRSMIGDILCTNAGFFGVGGLVLTIVGASEGWPFILAAAISLVIAGISTYIYIKNKPQLYKDLAEQRRLESDNQQKLFKGVKNFLYHPEELAAIQNLLGYSEEDKRAIRSQVQSFKFYTDEYKDKKAVNKQHYANLTKANKDSFHTATLSGDREWLKYLMHSDSKHIPIPDKDTIYETDQKNILHLAAEKGNLLFIEKILSAGISDKARKNKNQWSHLATDPNFVTKSARYTELTKNAREMLLSPDKNGLLPLHYAAKLSDRSTYELFLNPKILAFYSKEQLKLALTLRTEPTTMARSKSRKMAVLASICPMGSLTEILTSLTFIGLTLSTLAIGLSVFGVSLLIFAGVCWANYYKGQRERGIIDGLEPATIDLAYANIIKQGLEKSIELKPDDLKDKQDFIEARRKNSHKTNLPNIRNYKDLLDKKDYAAVIGSTLGSFLCSFAGVSSLGELVFTLSGPLDWVVMLISAATIALLFAGIYYYNSIHDLKSVADLRQKVYQMEENTEEIVFSNKTDALYKPSAPPAARKATIELVEPGQFQALFPEAKIEKHTGQQIFAPII